jgi:tight adherence protein C
MGFAIFVFCVVFLLITSGGLLLFYREAMLQRISEVINPHPKQKTLLDTLQQTGYSLGGVIQQFKNVLPKSQAEVSVVQQRLIRAGYRNESAVNFFYGCKVLVPLLLCAVVLVTGLGDISPFFVYVTALGFGFLVPDFWLGRQITNRQKRIRLGLPDVLDLLVICIEAHRRGTGQGAAGIMRRVGRSGPGAARRTAPGRYLEESG